MATPPPMPAADATSGLTAEMARMAPPPAPLLWRSVAFVVDTALFLALSALLLQVWLIPEYYATEYSVTVRWFKEYFDSSFALAERMGAGEITQEAYLNGIAELTKKTPEAFYELLSYCASAVTLICWIGFTLTEVLTGGVSFGKKMVRIRTATFPYAEKPGFIDSSIRSLWKALAVTAAGPFAILFAILDAHWPLFNPLRRSLHDYLSRTVVLDTRFDPPPKKTPERVDDPDADEDE